MEISRSGQLCLCSLLSAYGLWAQPTIIEYPIPTSGSRPQGITAGPDGNLWFVETAANKIGKVTTAGTITEYPIPTASSGTTAIAQGPDGNLWFTEGSASQFGRITTSGTITEYSGTNLWQPYGITSGPDGNMWFAYGAGVGKITPGGAVTLYQARFTYFPANIVAGPDGNLWFTNTYSSGSTPGNLGKITTAGTITEVPLSVGYSSNAIASGPDGELWFTGDGGGLGSITTAGAAAYYLFSGGSIYGMAAGPDGNLWLAQYNGIPDFGQYARNAGGFRGRQPLGGAIYWDHLGEVRGRSDHPRPGQRDRRYGCWFRHFGQPIRVGVHVSAWRQRSRAAGAAAYRLRRPDRAVRGQGRQPGELAFGIADFRHHARDT